MICDIEKKIRYTISFLMRKIVHVNLQLLYECNFKCTICDFWKDEYKNKSILTLNQIERINLKLKEIGPQVISIGGGEPLLHKDIVKIAKILSKNNFAVMICNGWYMTPEIAHALFNAGMYEISISVDYADPLKHDKQRGKSGAFDRAVNALRILNENRVYPYQRVHMISVIMDDNVCEIEPLIKLSKKLGVTYLVTLYSDNRGKKVKRAPDLDIGKYLLKLKKKYPEFVALRGYLGRFTEAIENNGIYPCYGGKNLINIDSQGNVTFCIDHLEKPAGNILNDDMSDIIMSLKNQMGKNNCIGCWTSCRGSIESLMYDKGKLLNLFDYYQMTKDISIKNSL
ncbi:MAG: radical SAM protein [Desulfobacterales bacterium]|nr:radical SAM protein [Desulfobacterales bacterium]